MPKDLLGRLLMDLAGDALGTSAHGVSPKQMRRQLKRLRKGKISPLVALGGAGALVALGGALAQGGGPSSSMARGTAPRHPAAGGPAAGGPTIGRPAGLPLPTASRSAPPPLPPLPVTSSPPPAPTFAAPAPPPVPQAFATPPPLPPGAGIAPPSAAIPAAPPGPPPVPAAVATAPAPQLTGTPQAAAPAPNAPAVENGVAEAPPPIPQAPEASPQSSPQSSPQAAPQDRSVAIATPPPIPLPVDKPTPPPWDEDLAHRLLYPLVRTLIAAALCDGHLSPAERESLIGHLEGSGLNDAQVHQVRRDLSMPATRHELADLLQETLGKEDQERSGEAKELLYRAALAAILIDQRRDPAEDRWLAGFARALELPEVRRQRADSSPSDLSQLLPVLDT